MKEVSIKARIILLIIGGLLFMLYPYNALKYLEQEGIIYSDPTMDTDDFFIDAYEEKKIERGRDPDSFDLGSYMDSGLGYPEPVRDLLRAFMGACLLALWICFTWGVPFFILLCWINRDGGITKGFTADAVN